jgi:fatty acid desaturase
MTDHAQRRRVTEFLSAAEIRELTTASDARGLLAVATTWAMIAASFALVGLHPRWWTIVIALIVIGGRQLALSILMHDAAHRSLFRTRRLNLVIGQWLCAAPIWTSLARYREHHLQHHAHTNEAGDPDLALVAPFPITRASLARKFARDLLGLTGLKRVVALLAMDFGVLAYTASVTVERVDQHGRTALDVIVCGLRNFGPVLLTNVALWSLLRTTGHAELYLLWIGAYLSSFSLVLRIRAMAEHACTNATTDPFFNTRTTHANFAARLTVAPHAVNYHLEHHLLPTVPLYSLARMHELLRQRGALDGCHLSTSYRDMLRIVTSAH